MKKNYSKSIFVFLEKYKGRNVLTIINGKYYIDSIFIMEGAKKFFNFLKVNDITLDYFSNNKLFKDDYEFFSRK